MKRFVLALVGWAALTGSVAAADLARPVPQPYYQAPVAAQLYNWTGFYIGVNGGGAFGRSAWDPTGHFNMSGGIVGGTVGYNYQFGQAVVGVEGDIDWAGISGTTNNLCPLGCKTSDSWLSTVRGRLGYAADRFMPFVTGGAAFGNIQATTPGFIGASSSQVGLTVGAGLEFAIAGNWTAKAEYLYVDLGKFTCGLSCGVLPTNNVSFTTNLVRAGVNYRF
ncbi:MAG TPA: outer membrane protein [Xanthobacteraceae bacterium]|nr:outer membrane protein [Xanthobacteraceae bacterium]